MKTNRYRLLDELRGLTLVSMLVYHGCWDLVYMFHVKAPWYESRGAFYWQQSICWTFIFISGFCWHFGKNKLRHAMKIFLGGAVITFATLLFMPADRVVFGILTFLGSAAFIVILLNNILKYIKPSLGFPISLLLFGLTKQVNAGYLGTGFIKIAKVPDFFYRNLATAFLGFPGGGFYSTDYFSIFPWLFLYIAGYYCYLWMEETDRLKLLDTSIFSPLCFPGRYSFWIYMAHQPVLYLLLSIWFFLFPAGGR